MSSRRPRRICVRRNDWQGSWTCRCRSGSRRLTWPSSWPHAGTCRPRSITSTVPSSAYVGTTRRLARCCKTGASCCCRCAWCQRLGRPPNRRSSSSRKSDARSRCQRCVCCWRRPRSSMGMPPVHCTMPAPRCGSLPGINGRNGQRLLRSECAGQLRSRVSVRRVDAVVTALAEAGWRAAAMEARLLAAKLLLERGHLAQGRAHLRYASRARRGSGPATLRARAWYAEALLRSSTSDRRGAASAIRAGLRVLDRHRAVLGATDLRAHVAGYGTELAEVGLRMAIDDGRPRGVFEWAEGGRASHLLQQPLRPPQDASLADALAELRATVTEINSIDGAGRDGGKLAKRVQRQVALERQLQDHSRRQRGEPTGPPPGPVPPGAVAETLGEHALLEFIQLDGILHGVSIVEGRARLRRLGSVSQVGDLLERIPFALHRLSRRGVDVAGSTAAVRLLRHAGGGLDDVLLRPFAEIGDRSLVIVPTAPLQCLLWSVLPSCVGRPLTVAPSATMWHAASRQAAEQRSHVVAAGPTLAGARDEARAVADIYGTNPLLHPAATVDAVMTSLNGAAVAHLATHGRLSAHNPLFSDLLFSNGPLLVYDLEGLQQVPHTVVLAACDSARSVVCAGDELLGLSATFLAQGATQLVASVLAILDAETAPLMIAFHRLLARGQPPAVALAAAQQQMAAEKTTMAAAAGFVCVGAGFVPPTLPAYGGAGA